MQVRTLYADLLASGSVRNGGPLAPATVAATHRVLRKACNDALAAGLIGQARSSVSATAPACARMQTWTTSGAFLLPVTAVAIASARWYSCFRDWAAQRRDCRSAVGGHRLRRRCARGAPEPNERRVPGARKGGPGKLGAPHPVSLDGRADLCSASHQPREAQGAPRVTRRGVGEQRARLFTARGRIVAAREADQGDVRQGRSPKCGRLPRINTYDLRHLGEAPAL